MSQFATNYAVRVQKLLLICGTLSLAKMEVFYHYYETTPEEKLINLCLS